MHWLVDLSLRDDRLRQIKDALDKTNSSHTYFGLTTEEHTFTGIDYEIFNQHDNFIALSYINAIKICTTDLFTKYNLYNFESLSEKEINNVMSKMKKSFFYDDDKKFDQFYYSNLGLPLLNDKPIFLSLIGQEELIFDTEKFIKPSKDLKAFTGGLIQPHQTIKDFVEKGRYQAGWNEEIALISEVKEIEAEYRFFVLDDKVITGSRYIFNKEVIPSPIVPKDVLDVADEYAKLYKPHDLFTMDIAVMKNGEYKIVEYNAFNGSGHYECDLVKLFNVLNDVYKNKAP